MSPPKKLNLQEHVAAPAKKQLYVNQMFATIAPRYDLVTTLMSYGQDKRWKRKLVAMADVHPHHQVLDLACGTGDITFLLARQLDSRGKALGVDITPEMVERARGKGLDVPRTQGSWRASGSPVRNRTHLQSGGIGSVGCKAASSLHSYM